MPDVPTNDDSGPPPASELDRLLRALIEFESLMAATDDPTDSEPLQIAAPVERFIAVHMRATRVFTHTTSTAGRYPVVDALGRLGDPGAVAPLLERLDDADAVMRRVVVGALGLIGDRRAVQPLISALSDDDARIRRRAAIALGQIGDPAALEALTALLHDQDDAVRLRSAEVLGTLQDPRSARPLGLVLGRPHERWFVRRAAARALGWLGSEGRAELIDRSERDPHIRKWTAWVLRRVPADDEPGWRPGYPLLTHYSPPSRALGSKRRGHYVTNFLRDAPTD